LQHGTSRLSTEGEKRRVLIVDECAEIVEILTSLLESGGCRTSSSHDYRLECADIVSNRPDLAIIDIPFRQPERASTLISLCDRLRIPVILTATPATYRSSLPSSLAPLRKPYRLAEMTAKIQLALADGEVGQ